MISRVVIGGLFAAGAGVLAYLLAKGKPDATVGEDKPTVTNTAEAARIDAEEVPHIDQPESDTVAPDTGGDN